MRDLPPAFAAHLSSGATTLCRCWTLIRRDGVALGFTDHDRDLIVGGAVFLASSGLEGSEVEFKAGLAVGSSELVGALTSEALTEVEIAGGVWDDATVETWLVDWADPSTRILLDIGQIGEIRREDHRFTAEVRGVAQRFDEERGRIYQARCNADLGDARCGIDLAGRFYTSAGVVVATDGRTTLSAHLADAFSSGWFDAGSISFVSGANSGALVETARHSVDGAQSHFVLRHAPAAPIEAGDAIVARAGCDKSLETCRSKFANVVNFRGFPSIPTNDFVLTYARQGAPGQTGEVIR